MAKERVFGSFHCTLQQLGGVLCLVVKGELDLVSVAEFRAFVEDVRGANEIVFDLRDLSYLDSVGLRMFLGIHRTLSDRKQRIVLAHPSSLVRRILDLAGIGNVIPICGSVRQALSYLRSQGAKELPLAEA